jgi:GNAT superfamily N-acetyltransferase
MAHSLSMGIFQEQCQVGFGRAVTDRSTFAYLADVFVLPEHRGRGLGKWLVDCFMEHPELQGLRRWLLATADAHALYSRAGFVPLKVPDKWMEKVTPTKTA